MKKVIGIICMAIIVLGCLASLFYISWSNSVIEQYVSSYTSVGKDKLDYNLSVESGGYVEVVKTDTKEPVLKGRLYATPFGWNDNELCMKISGNVDPDFLDTKGNKIDVHVGMIGVPGNDDDYIDVNIIIFETEDNQIQFNQLIEGYDTL